MPTGYTAAILEGASFKEYALRCARNFGALIMMRDEPMDAPIPDKFEPSEYYTTALGKAKKELARLNDLTNVGWEKELDNWHSKRVAEFWDSKKKNALEKEKYEAMLKQAKAYKAPTPDHEEYAKFLVSQIEQSIQFDCGYYDKLEEPVKPSLATFIGDQLDEARKDIAYYNKSYTEELEQTEGRNKWIQALKKSLEP